MKQPTPQEIATTISTLNTLADYILHITGRVADDIEDRRIGRFLLHQIGEKAALRIQCVLDTLDQLHLWKGAIESKAAKSQSHGSQQ